MSSLVPILSKFSFLYVLLCATALAQEPTAKPADTPPPSEKATVAKHEEKPALPFQIQLLETHIRFETNGDSRKEVHTIVKINDLAGARQFSRLGFDYNRAFQQVEIPLVKINHANGGTSEILPSAITDAPNPAVQDFPAYHDVRVKSVRILGLQDGDTIEYRVITTLAKHPLAPDFWLEHSFDRSGQLLEEYYELDFPASRQMQIHINPATPVTSVEKEEGGLEGRISYMWKRKHSNNDLDTDSQIGSMSDVMVTTFASWDSLSTRMVEILRPLPKDCESVSAKTADLTKASRTNEEKVEEIYNFVSQRIRTVDLPLGLTGFRTRQPVEVVSSGYGTREDKFALFYAMAFHFYYSADAAFSGEKQRLSDKTPSPSLLTNLLILTEIPGPRNFRENGKVLECAHCEWTFWLTPDLEVAPFGMVPATLRGKEAITVGNPLARTNLRFIPNELPFSSMQTVHVAAMLAKDGSLSAQVNYNMRGDNELLLRTAFHQTPKERWKEVAGLLALSDGFRGTITSVTASDPMATKDPFSVEYEITQAKFVDWSKKPVRIPALLPQIAMPNAPEKTAAKIELGTPLDVQTSLTLKLPEGTTVQTPAATSVARDYATFISKYDGHLNIVSVSRHINFLKREIPSERVTDYNAFLRAVQNDQAQLLVLLPPPAATATTP